MKNLSKMLWGVIFIVIGVIWGINSLGIAQINVFFEGWWTLFIIVPSIIGIINSPKEMSGYIFLAVGVSLLLCSRDIISYSLIFKLLVPAIFVCIGISIIFKDTINSNVEKKIKEIDKDGTEIYVASFSENKVKLQGNEFNNAKLDASFGTVKFDISECDILEDKYIKASAVFGEVSIIVPSHVNVKVKSNNIFGGTTNKIQNHNIDDKKTIYIDSFALFGGVNIQ